MTFDVQKHIMQVTGKDYLPVQFRLVWFREQCPQGTIETEMVLLDLERETSEDYMQWSDVERKKVKVTRKANGFCIFRATVTDGKGGSAQATKSEKAAAFPDFLEKCETGAIGRALAMLGFGTQFTGDEMDEKHRLADAPVSKGGANTTGK